MKLINGKGQLGDALSKLEGVDCLIYHTWNIDDHSNNTQKKEFLKFKDFVDKHSGDRIVFISTTHPDYCDYLRWKLEAEMYLWLTAKNGQVIRIPSMIGKGGIYDKCKKGEELRWGYINIDTINNVAKEIVELIKSDKKLQIIDGDPVRSDILQELINVGRK